MDANNQSEKQNHKCIVIVPYREYIEKECEQGLHLLERQGYPVLRQSGISAIDMARSEIASACLAKDIDEIMWIDSDIAFQAEWVEKLRSHNLDFVCGAYVKKGKKEFCHNFEKEGVMRFGTGGGLVKLTFAACGFTLVKKTAYEKVKAHYNLPLVNTEFGQGFFRTTCR